MAEIRVTEEVAIQAPVDEVWTVITAPDLQSRLDPRVALRSISGEPGAVDTVYELGIGAVAKSDPFRTTVTVLEAVPRERYVTVHRVHKNATRHTMELLTDRQGTTLRWTVSGQAGLMRKSREAKLAAEVVRWLGVVAELAESPS